MQINKDKNERLGIECDKMDRNMATTHDEMIAEAEANGNLNVLCQTNRYVWIEETSEAIKNPFWESDSD